MRLSAKVLVIGGGPAGATVARFLAESGIDVILLEKNLSFIKPCGGGISLNVFDEYALPKNLIKREVKGIRIISPKGEQVEIDLKGENLAIIERREFNDILLRLAEEKGAKVIEGDFTGFLNHENCTVEVNIGGIKSEIAADYIIAADGVNSKVRASLGIKPVLSFYTASDYIRGLNSDVCEFWFGSNHAPRSYSWVFPAAEGITVGTGSIEQGIINTLFEMFIKRKGILIEDKKRIYRIPIWKGDLYNKGRVIFAGDSAGQVLPLSYEGIYYAMKSGEFAAQAVMEEKVNNYKRIWKARFQKRFLLMDKLGNYFLKDDVSAEKLVALHRRPEIQEASLRLWLRKESSKKSILSYIRFFGKFLR
jgi:geranylgeranyl diphosphate/geranylgeranyl-bacteriochlorophyllide a reductase